MNSKKYISVEDAIKTTWMILKGLGYAIGENPQLKGTVPAIFDTAPTIDAVPSAQPELTDERAIEHLQSTGWMQNHDKEMYEMGLRERLADDSDSYDSLIPSAEPERKTGRWIIDYLCSTSGGTYQVLRCSICKHLEQPWQLGLNFCPNCGTRMKGEDNA